MPWMTFAENPVPCELRTVPLRLRRVCVLGLAVFLAVFFFGAASLSAATAKSKYFQADAAYKSLRNSAAKKKYRENWICCIKKYQAVYRHDPDGPWAAAGLFMSGKLYCGLAVQSGLESDLREAADIFQRVIKRFPRSRYRSRSEQQLKLVEKRLGGPVEAPTAAAPASVETLIRATDATLPISAGTGAPVTVTGLRYWSNPSYTRVVIDANRETTFAHRLLKKDPTINKPPRLFIDLTNSRVGERLQSLVPINDDLLSNARAGQNTPDLVRVVMDIKSFDTYKVFSLKNPFRIVVDVWGENTTTTAAHRPTGVTDSGDNLGVSALARQLALGVRRIVIDPGHGGKDFGAPGYLKGIHEKDVVLKISKKLAERIRNELGCEVIMTRSTDRYLTLEERTAIANTQNADLFISVHTNSHRDRRAFGIETYFLNLATDNDAILVAARENATSAKNISDLQSILNDLMHNAKVNESSRLADHVQTAMCSGLAKRYRQVKDKGVKQAPFYVLLGAQMPAILVETSFISNARECKRLVDGRFQEELVDAIIDGVRRYMLETNPTALSARPAKQG